MTIRTSGHKTISEKAVISYVVSDQVWWCNIKRFLSYSKNYICKFLQASPWHHKLFYFHLSIWIWKVWKVKEKITKLWISQEQKELSLAWAPTTSGVLRFHIVDSIHKYTVQVHSRQHIHMFAKNSGYNTMLCCLCPLLLLNRRGR